MPCIQGKDGGVGSWTPPHLGRITGAGLRRIVPSSLLEALLQACLAGLMYASFFYHLRIFLPASADSLSLFRPSKHPGPFFSHLITNRLHSFLSTDALHHVDFIRYSAKWSCLPGRGFIITITEQRQPIVFPIPPSLITNERLSLLVSSGTTPYRPRLRRPLQYPSPGLPHTPPSTL